MEGGGAGIEDGCPPYPSNLSCHTRSMWGGGQLGSSNNDTTTHEMSKQISFRATKTIIFRQRGPSNFQRKYLISTPAGKNQQRAQYERQSQVAKARVFFTEGRSAQKFWVVCNPQPWPRSGKREPPDSFWRNHRNIGSTAWEKTMRHMECVMKEIRVAVRGEAGVGTAESISGMLGGTVSEGNAEVEATGTGGKRRARGATQRPAEGEEAGEHQGGGWGIGEDPTTGIRTWCKRLLHCVFPMERHSAPRS